MSPKTVKARVRGIGVAVITRRSAGPRPCSEARGRIHAETVLLVHHREAQIAEGHGLLEQRVGADQDIDLPVGKLGQSSVLSSPGRGR